MLPAIWRLLIWGLVSCGPAAPMENARAQDMGQGTPAPVTLSDKHSTGSFPVDSQTLASAPPILRVSITRVVNPERTPIRVSVYLERVETGRPGLRKIPIGNFTLYPTDAPAAFVLPSSAAFRELQAESPLTASSEVRLWLELERIRATKPWTRVEVTVGPAAWCREEH